MEIHDVLESVIDQIVRKSRRVQFSAETKTHDGTSNDTTILCSAVFNIANGEHVSPPQSPRKRRRLATEIDVAVGDIRHKMYANVPRCGSRDFCMNVSINGMQPLLDYKEKHLG